MQTILEILKYILPSIITFLTAWFIIRQFIDNEQKKSLIAMKSSASQTIMPVRLQAYERVLLLLERISLQSLVMRVHQAGMTAAELHQALLQTVRQEYDHNLSQQLYISPDAWELIRNAKEEVIKVVNTCAGRMPEQAEGKDLATDILEETLKMGRPMTTTAILFIKKEVRQIYG